MSDNHYPDFPPDSLGDPAVKKLERLPKPIGSSKPKIKWGKEYLSWPIQKRLDYAEDLAASMNQAAQIIQEERDKLVELARSQEEKLIQATRRIMDQGELMNRKLGEQNARMQELYQAIQTLKAALREAEKQKDGA